MLHLVEKPDAGKELFPMKVLRLHKPFDLRFADESVPKIGADEVLIKVGSVGVCASDVHYYRHGRIGDQVVENPQVMGHEFSGTVVAVGQNVHNLSEGARVAVEPGKPCGECYACRRGYVNLCPNVVFFGTPPVDGCLQEFVAWSADLCIPVSDSVSLDEAAMIEPIAVGVYAVDMAEFVGGESLAILGAGAIGLSVLQAAKAAGAGKIIVSDPIKERRDLAAKLGADVVVDTANEDVVAKVMEQTEVGAQVIFECAGSKEAIYQTTSLLRPRGRILIVGIPDEDSYDFPGSLSRKREANVQFVRRSRDVGEKSVEMVDSKIIDAASLATHVFTFEHADEAFKLAMSKENGVIRAVIRVSEE